MPRREYHGYSLSGRHSRYYELGRYVSGPRETRPLRHETGPWAGAGGGGEGGNSNGTAGREAGAEVAEIED